MAMAMAHTYFPTTSGGSGWVDGFLCMATGGKKNISWSAQLLRKKKGPRIRSLQRKTSPIPVVKQQDRLAKAPEEKEKRKKRRVKGRRRDYK